MKIVSHKQLKTRALSLMLPLAIAVTFGISPRQARANCSSQSGNSQLHLVELYTSEGCNSCPPAEKWLSSLRQHPQFVGLEFHVDYWDSMDWKDPFSSRAYTQRQQTLAKRSNHGQIYTPQIWLDGHLWYNWPKGTPPVPAQAPTSTLTANVEMGTPLRVTFDALDPAPKDGDSYQLYAALTESGLSQAITGGENKGKTLALDFVVRAFTGPLPMPHAQVEFKLPEHANIDATSVVGFLQDERDGTITQVVRVPLDQCRK